MLIINIKGKNINKFIKRLYDNKIKLYKIKKINDNEVIIYIRKEDYEKISKIKTIYEIKIIGLTGNLKIKEKLKKNINLIISIIIGIITIYLLSKITFEINIITNNKELQENILQELKVNGIYKYSIQKNYKELNEIKLKIKEKYHNNIEWIEIQNVGVNCIVKLEERIENKKNEENEPVNIVALKDGIIMNIKASNGEILKRNGQSVKKGDVIISGKITLNDNVKEIVNAKGKVMAEVWYKTNISYPLTYYEEKMTGKIYNRYSIKLLKKEINLFKKTGKVEKIPIIENNIISLYKNKIYELEIIDNVYNYDEAIEKALELGRSKIKSKLNDDEYIIYEKCLKVSLKDSKIEVEVFYAVYENITGYERIEING